MLLVTAGKPEDLVERCLAQDADSGNYAISTL